MERKIVGSEFGSAEKLVTELTDLTSFLSHIALAGAFRTSYLIVDDVLAARK
jgi:hypothetical protein